LSTYSIIVAAHTKTQTLGSEVHERYVVLEGTVAEGSGLPVLIPQHAFLAPYYPWLQDAGRNVMILGYQVA
jgi:hypothetical protein